MTTPDGLTAESEALIADYHGRMHEVDCECDAAFIRDPLRAIEAAAVARHVRETDCEGLREAVGRLVKHYPRRDYGPADEALADVLAALASPATEALTPGEIRAANDIMRALGAPIPPDAPSPATEAERRGGEW